MCFKRMSTDAAGLGLRRSGRKRAEDDERFGVLRDRIQRVGLAAAGRLAAERMPQDDRAGRNAVGVDMAGKPADEVKCPL